MQGGSQIKEEENNLIEEYIQPKEKEPTVQVIKDIGRMTLKKEDSLLEEESEAEEENSSVLNATRIDIDPLSDKRTRTQAQEMLLLLQQWKAK